MRSSSLEEARLQAALMPPAAAAGRSATRLSATRALLGIGAAFDDAAVLDRLPRVCEELAGGAVCASPVIPATTRAARSCAVVALVGIPRWCSVHFAMSRSRIVGILQWGMTINLLRWPGFRDLESPFVHTVLPQIEAGGSHLFWRSKVGSNKRWG